MTQLNEWLLEGKEKWKLVESHGEIIIPWNNPWYRFAIVALIGCIVAAAGYFWLQMRPVWIIGIGVAALGCITALRFYVRGFRVGSIAAAVSRDGCSIGCGYDRLFIPWSAVETEVERLPINDQYMLIPIRPDASDQLELQFPDKPGITWDGQLYKRAIIRAEFHLPSRGVRIFANPNEIMVYFLSFLYPVMAYRADAIKKGYIQVTPHAESGPAGRRDE